VKARLRDWFIAAGVLLLGRGKPRPEEPETEEPKSPVAEAWALLLLMLSQACAVAFVVVYALDSIPTQTQFLGLALGLALLLFAAALIVMGRKLVDSRELDHDYPPVEHESEQEQIVEIFDEGGARLTRRRLFKLGLLGTGGTLLLALATPLLSLGRFLDTTAYRVTPWRRGRRLVDEDGRPLRADEIEEKTFYTAFPEGADREDLAAPLVVVRMPPSDLRLPQELAGFDADGIVAYSKICTHAGCAVAMYRTPLFQPTAPKPALVCPCHYSTFDPAAGGRVLFGPAGRPLPMLPLEKDEDGYLRARGNFSDQVGPSWWGVRIWRPTA
jgi:ubiquinol-cytochrome c reductase iron-sulfur subunit